jgi:hypothetical protein
MKDYSKTEGVPDYPLPHSKRLELNFSHVEMGWLTRQAIIVLITFGYKPRELMIWMVFCENITWILRLLLFYVSLANIIGSFLIPLTLLSLLLLSSRMLGHL